MRKKAHQNTQNANKQYITVNKQEKRVCTP